MRAVLRPAMYGAQHPIKLIPATAGNRGRGEYLVVGHCCESGDVLTPAPGNPERLVPRSLPEARLGDLLVIGGTGAYCSGMAARNYNSFPEAAEVMITRSGSVELIRKRQTLDQIIENEVAS
jgi:diaminopimelate decarboxylase